MSGWEWVGLVETRKLGDARRKAVLNFLARAADQEGRSYWGIPRIAAATDVGERKVRTILQDMEGEGLIRRERRSHAGRRGTYDTWLLWGPIAALPWNGITRPGVDGDPFAQVTASGTPGAAGTEEAPAPAVPRGPDASGTPGAGRQRYPGGRAEDQGEDQKGRPDPAAAPPAPEPSAEDGPTITAEHRSEGVSLTRAVYDRRKARGEPEPAKAFMGAAMIAARFLALGYDRQALGRAMYRAATITVAAVELELRKGSQPGPTTSADERRGGMMTDRTVSGVWTPPGADPQPEGNAP